MGDSDTGILLTILIIFVLLGALLPFLHEAFGQDQTNVNAGGVAFATGQNIDEASGVTILDVIFSIVTIFFWTFGNIPLLMDLILFVPLRIIFIVILYRNLRGI